jgi:hypothetical protein
MSFIPALQPLQILLKDTRATERSAYCFLNSKVNRVIYLGALAGVEVAIAVGLHLVATNLEIGFLVDLVLSAEEAVQLSYKFLTASQP